MKIRFRRGRKYQRSSTVGGTTTTTTTAKGTRRYSSKAPSTTTESSYTPGFANIDTSSSGPGQTGGLLIMLVVLYVLALWNGLFKQTWHTIWTGEKLATTTNGWVAAGGLLFIFMIVSLAKISKDWENAMWVITIGMWMVYLMFNGSGQLKTLANKTSQSNNTQLNQSPKSNPR